MTTNGEAPIRILLVDDHPVVREGVRQLIENEEDCQQLHLSSPILTNAQLQYIKEIDKPGLRSAVISTLFDLMFPHIFSMLARSVLRRESAITLPTTDQCHSPVSPPSSWNTSSPST